MRRIQLVFCLLTLTLVGCGGTTPQPEKPQQRASGQQPAESERPAIDAGPLSADEDAALQRAIGLMDAGQLDESMAIIDELLVAHPGHPTLTYEKAFVVYKQGDYAGSRALIEPMLKGEHGMALMFVLVANAYDDEGKSDDAVKVYTAGIERFPDAGLLYTNLGITLLRSDELSRAIETFVNGIAQQPSFPSNYYWLGRLMAGSNAKIWGLIYGELFANLEPGGPRKAEISKALYGIYSDAITASVSGAKASAQVKLDSTARPADKAGDPCMSVAYEANLLLALAADSALTATWAKRPLDIATIHQLRKAADRAWRDKWAATCPNLALARYAAAVDANLGEAYDYWLFNEAVPEQWNTWSSANPDKVRALETWLSANRLAPTATDRFGLDHY